MNYIIITAFKEEKTIEKTIKSIQKQTKDKIIVSAPDEGTINIAKKFNVEIFQDPGKGKAYALNLLFKRFNKKEDILIFTDGDVFLYKEAIKEILRPFKNKGVGCVAGRPVALNKKTNKIGFFSHLLLDNGAHKIRLENHKKNKFIECSGYLFATRTGLINEIPLDVAEDSVIPYLIWKQGYKIAYAPKAKVYVKYPETLKDFVRQRKRAGVGSHSKLDHYYPDFPRVKNFKNEVKKGIMWALQYPQNLKEMFWTLQLFFIRFYIWFIYYFEVYFKKKSYQDGWERIESTKT